ncbi:hypothetical protein ACHAXR_000754 [Thalassiosira sp. AJA248-18]
MDFGTIPTTAAKTNNATKTSSDDDRRLVIEQRKQLGKGGFCWDAGFILGEHVIAHEEEWNISTAACCPNNNTSSTPTRVVELGAGTGLTGLMIAKSVTTNCSVEITDLPQLQDLMRDNIDRNFGKCNDDETANNKDNSNNAKKEANKGGTTTTITSRILQWGHTEDYGTTPYDVIIGADIVTSLYDPVSLAHTLHDLSGPHTKIYISGKARLDKPHEEFDGEMERLFDRVVKIREPSSRLKSPNVFVIVAEGKKKAL